jgi:hypothetical protein
VLEGMVKMSLTSLLDEPGRIRTDVRSYSTLP